uniref:Uncharacterized protein n=1 Tax=Peronospora matthiolae TaxID=2874970 RepID=A0AAV1TCD9_9STRA
MKVYAGCVWSAVAGTIVESVDSVTPQVIRDRREWDRIVNDYTKNMNDSTMNAPVHSDVMPQRQERAKPLVCM